MSEEPTPPATVPSDLIEGCRTLSPDQLRELARYAKSLAEYQDRQTRAADEESHDADPDQRPDGVPAGASVTVKEINDNRYRYWQWRDGDTIKSKYIGPAETEGQ